jgi:hypothetical protein
MSKTIEISDDLYAALLVDCEAHQYTQEDMLRNWHRSAHRKVIELSGRIPESGASKSMASLMGFRRGGAV